MAPVDPQDEVPAGHEGRVWYTPHRGTLWIASTPRQPPPGEVREVERLHRGASDTLGIPFPEHYPVGCLLGRLHLTECLPEEEYNRQYPEGESGGSPYVFICERPEQLLIKFPIKGKHKIFTLDSRIHQAARKSLEKHQLQLMTSMSD